MRTTGRWVRKRALSMLLACAMLFSNVELTAFATEPGMETLQPGDESGTTGENEVTEEEDGTEDSDTEEDVDGTGGSEDDGTGEQTPEDEIDTGKEPGNPEQEDDAADGEEAEGEDQESNDPDKEDPSESDQTEDSDGTVEEEEDSDVTDGNDENEEDGTADDSGKTEEDDSVSENSVSENSVAENSISENSLITVNAKSSFGRALTSTVPIEMTAAGSGSEIDKVIIDGMGAEVHLYGPAAENCMLVVGIYDEISERQIATANVEVSIGETVVSVSFEDTLPQYFIVRAFLVENDTYRPLCGRYESNDYTRTMQEFYNKTTADFAADQIINLDESEDNNFVVFSDYVKVIRAGSDGTTNKVVACDEENLVYMIENPDETVTGLKAGETFAYLCDDNGAIITTIVEIIINEQNNLVEIHGSGENLNDVFEFIKIGACNPRNTMMRMARESALEGELKEVLKFSFDDEKIELGVRTTDDGEVETQPVKWEGLEQTINNLENLFQGIFGDDLKDSLKTLKNMGLSADLTVSAYTDGYVHFVKEEKPRGAQLVVRYQADIEINYGNSETVGGNGDDDKNSGEEILKTPSLKVELPLIPSLPKEFLSVTAQIHFEMDIGGSLYILANVDGSAGLTVDLEKRSVEKIGGSPNWEVKIGAELEFEPKLVFGIDASFLKWGENVPGNRAAGIAGEIEAGATITLRKPDIEVSSNKQHECREKHNNDGDSGKFYCISGELVPLLGIEAEIDFVGFEFNIAEDFFDELEEKIGENNKIDFYCSFAFGDFGKGKCPHEKYKVTVKVKKNEVPVSGARVNDESDTSKNGCVERWESPGFKRFYAVKDGIIGNRWVKISKPGQTIVINLRTGEAGAVEGSAVEQVCAGDQARSCAVITRDGRLYRWGDNCYGQIGDATLENRYEPVHIPLPGKVVRFMENNGSSAAVVQNGTLGNALYMWGRNEYGQLGNDTKNNVNVPPDKPLMDGVREVCLGNRLTAVIKETGELYLCGSISGQTMTTPTKVLPGQKIKQVATNQYSREGHIAAVTESGDLYLWGDNQSGQIGNGKNESNVLSPVQILLEEKVKQVSLGDGHSAAVTEDGRLYLWGDNSFGQIGNGGKQVQYVPVEISLDDQKVRQVHLAQCYSMAITEAGDLYAWGVNDSGIIGKGTPSDTAKFFDKPQKITELKHVKAIDSETLRGFCNAALQEDGSLYLWGDNRCERIGKHGEFGYSVSPPVMVLDKVKQVSLGGCYSDTHGGNNNLNVGGGFCVAVKEDGSLWTWGCNSAGQLGRGKYITDRGIGMVTIPEDKDSRAYEAEAYTADDSPQITPDPANPVKQTAGFTGLTLNDIHNIYVMRSREADDVLGSDNLLYIGQSVSDAEGRLTVTYEMKEAFETPVVFCVGMTRTDLTAAEITLADIIYDGEEHLVEPQVVLNGRTLVEGEQYDLYGDCIVKEQGEYKIVVRGTGLYSGEKEVTFHVKEGGDNPDDGDNPGGDDSEYGDVREEDIPADGIIPAGLWIAGISEDGYTYTGKAIRPEVRVYDNKTLLEEKTDYTIVYQNNILANITTDERTLSTITVTGKGNYEGKETQTFKIMPVDISSQAAGTEGQETSGDGTLTGGEEEDAFAADDMTIAHNGKAQKPLPTLYWNEKKLKNNTDYTITYYDSTGEMKLASVKDNGSYYIRLAGKGNFTGERTIRLTVTDKLRLMSKVTVTKVKNQPYTGAAIMPALTVKDGKSVLKEGEHYTIAYSRNTAVGTAYAVVTGIEKAGYSGTKRISFKITGTSIGRAVVTGLTGTTFQYNGTAHEPALVLKVKDGGKEKTLTLDSDYKITWQKNLNAGTATVLFTGVGGYSGSLKKTFKINAFNIAENKENCFNVALTTDSVPYAKGGAKPDMTVTFRRPDGSEQKLQEGRDYTVTCQNNKALYDGSSGKQPSVTVKGKGNFSGTYATKLSYRIVPRNIGELELGVSDPVYQNKKNACVSKVTVTDIDGRALTAGKDYEKKPVYTYKSDTMLDNGTMRAAGSAVDRDDIVPAGTVLKVAVTAKNGGNYTGVLEGEYRITKASISKTAVTVRRQTYTGQEIILDKSDIIVRIKGKQVDESQFEIVEGSYKNNVKKGTASVTIRGVDNYGGTKTIKFTIKAKGFLWWRK